ncbi:MBL fold metallo-hydrolase [Piscinibacter sakaiensis]|uniref:SoxH homolog protein n=1 Tax=Piscinibacter sakaiensis TaxID=1547922 RepID=A0A0K8P970_PISS1|nr:MBL fold metallo-hydrolase [Piscinibacter sakaiensis]GAP38735.1 SoxH homolog protein [Piscinibacter sakaiensis]
MNAPSDPDAVQRLRRALLLLAAGGVAGFPRRARAASLQAREVAPGTWFVQGEAALGSAANRNFISNAAFVVTGDGVLLVDALGSPVLARELLAEIRRVTRQPLRHVVVTHYHADHIYGLQVFRDAGAEVIAHAAGRAYLHSDTAALRLQASREELAPWVDGNTRLTPADRWIEADTEIALGDDRFLIRHAGPAHTPEDLVVLAQRRRVLFAGDLVFRGRIPFVGQADSERWIATLRRMLEDRPAIMVPGHGEVSVRPGEDLQLTLDYLVFLRQAMGEAAAAMEPFEDAYARADWSRFDHLPLFRAANRMNAYNTYLLMEQAPSRR